LMFLFGAHVGLKRKGAEKLLLDGLAFLADDAFVGVADAFAFVRFRWVEAADFGCDLADGLAVRPFDGELGVFLDRHLDLVGYGIDDRVRIPEAEVYILTLDRGFEAHALNLEFLDEAFANATDHVIDQGAAEAMKGLGLGIIALTADHDLVLLNF